VPKRLDGEDTVDVATNLLCRWQAEGMGVDHIESQVEYAQVGKHRLPARVTVTVTLVPLHR
jgi:hypothetical protein